jgi:predicted nucleic acid-binding Zn ribbon protein
MLYLIHINYKINYIMFRRKVQSIQTLLPDFLRRQGLESPLRQRRLLTSWDEVVGEPIARYTSERFIKNQTLYVKVHNPALRADLSMGRSLLVKRLNERAGAQVIVDIKFY